MDYAALQNEWRTNPEYDLQEPTKILAEVPKSSLVWELENPQAVLLLRCISVSANESRLHDKTLVNLSGRTTYDKGKSETPNFLNPQRRAHVPLVGA